MDFSLLPQAQRDLRKLFTYIAKDNRAAAHRVRRAILRTCEMIADNPEIAHEIEDLSVPGIRMMPISKFKRYVLFYRINEEEGLIEIIRLGYGGRDWEGIFEAANDG